jgi:Co/Zn/Cd efflux system component
MGLSKTNRIIILLAIDTAFFFMELITGTDYLPLSGATMSFADLDVP